MKAEDRKAAIAAYKKRGAAARHLRDLLPGLRSGLGRPNPQSRHHAKPHLVFAAHGQPFQRRSAARLVGARRSELRLRTLEQLEDEELAYVRDKLLKERELHWRATLDGLSFRACCVITCFIPSS